MKKFPLHVVIEGVKKVHGYVEEKSFVRRGTGLVRYSDNCLCINPQVEWWLDFYDIENLEFHEGSTIYKIKYTKAKNIWHVSVNEYQEMNYRIPTIECEVEIPMAHEVRYDRVQPKIKQLTMEL